MGKESVAEGYDKAFPARDETTRRDGADAREKPNEVRDVGFGEEFDDFDPSVFGAGVAEVADKRELVDELLSGPLDFADELA